MNHHNKLSFLDYTPATLPPAQLFIGNHEQTVQAAEQLLQKILCPNIIKSTIPISPTASKLVVGAPKSEYNEGWGCNTCKTCMQIREKQHHAIMWLHPQKSYTLDDLNDLFSTLSFQLQPDELFFFIIQKADFLSSVCANKLLKPMEEPPTGYHFILLAEHPEQILPTIKSRCIIHSISTTQNTPPSHPLYEVFTTKSVLSHEFSKIQDSVTINERESIELLDQILKYWLEKYQQNHDANLLFIIEKFQKAQLQPPMPGSSTTFWRNLYLQTYEYLAKMYTISSL